MKVGGNGLFTNPKASHPLARTLDLVFSPIATVVQWYRTVKAKFDAHRFDEPTSQLLQTSIPRLKQFVKIYRRIHLGLFYLFGTAC